jgi:hypothetical protein
VQGTLTCGGSVCIAAPASDGCQQRSICAGLTLGAPSPLPTDKQTGKEANVRCSMQQPRVRTALNEQVGVGVDQLQLRIVFAPPAPTPFPLHLAKLSCRSQTVHAGAHTIVRPHSLDTAYSSPAATTMAAMAPQITTATGTGPEAPTCTHHSKQPHTLRVGLQPPNVALCECRHTLLAKYDWAPALPQPALLRCAPTPLTPSPPHDRSTKRRHLCWAKLSWVWMDGW